MNNVRCGGEGFFVSEKGNGRKKQRRKQDIKIDTADHDGVEMASWIEVQAHPVYIQTYVYSED
jgi:hypothetical protein